MELQWCPYKTQIQDFNETLLGPTEAPFRMSSKRNHKSEVNCYESSNLLKQWDCLLSDMPGVIVFFLLIDDDK